MPRTIAVHPEGARYAHSLVFIPGLWTRAEALRPVASFLGHRGWAGLIVEPGRTAGVAAAAADVTEVARGLPNPAILVGHDAGGLIALAAAGRPEVAGVVWLAPLEPPARDLTRILGAWRLAASLLGRRDVARPLGEAGDVLFGPTPADGLREREAVAFVRDVVRGRRPVPPATGPPMAVVVGERDRMGARVAVAGARRLVVEGAGRWLLGGERWQAVAGTIHRWLVHELGAPNLELYEEAMAERDEPEDLA
jgi:pimeloyl-ACP methyl ester carboxylesterase